MKVDISKLINGINNDESLTGYLNYTHENRIIDYLLNELSMYVNKKISISK